MLRSCLFFFFLYSHDPAFTIRYGGGARMNPELTVSTTRAVTECRTISTSTERPGHTTQPWPNVGHKAIGRSQELASRGHSWSANRGNQSYTTSRQSLNSDSWSEQFIPRTLSPRPYCYWAEWTIGSARTRNPRKRYGGSSSRPPPRPVPGPSHDPVANCNKRKNRKQRRSTTTSRAQAHPE